VLYKNAALKTIEIKKKANVRLAFRAFKEIGPIVFAPLLLVERQELKGGISFSFPETQL
jgi:hypothetical protein